MTKAKKLLALLLAVLTFVSVAAIGVNAEEAKTESTTATTETTTKAPETTTLSSAAKAAAKLFVIGGSAKASANKIIITANAKAQEISLAAQTNDGQSINAVVAEGSPVEVINGVCKVIYADWHYAIVKDAEGKDAVVLENKAEATITVDGAEYVVSFEFDGEDKELHRYDKKIGEPVKPTYDEVGYTIYECVCGAQARKDKVEKLPGKVVGVKCGADIGIAEKGSAKIVPVIETLGEPKYTVTYKSSDEKIATVNDKGEVTGIAIGKATITCTVKDDKGNTVEDKVNVKVSYSLVQWILVAAEAIVSGCVFIWDLILDALGLMK